MTPQTQQVFVILGALVFWTATVAAFMIWLQGKFDALKEFIRAEIKEQKEDDQKEFASIENKMHDFDKELDSFGLRLIKVELFTDPRRVPTYPLGNGQ